MPSSPAPAIFIVPDELLVTIAKETDRTDLLSLRLASKRLQATAKDAFEDKFFAKRNHLFTAHSLQKLVEITAQPALCSKLQMLTFSVLDIGYMTSHRHLLWNSSDDQDEEEPAILSESEIDAHLKKLFELQSAVVNEAPALLATCFNNLARAEATPLIRLGSHGSEHSWNHRCGMQSEGFLFYDQPYGYHTLLQTIPFIREYLRLDDSWLTPIELPGHGRGLSFLFNAISESDFKVRRFGLRHPGDPFGRDYQALQISNIGNLKTSFECLEYLDLDFGTSTRVWLPEDWLHILTGVADAAARTLREARVHLPTHRGWPWDPNGRDALWIADVLRGCSLKKLEICGYSHQPGSGDNGLGLFDLLREHRALSSIRLCPSNRMNPAMIAFIAQQMEVQHIKIFKDPHSAFGRYRLFCDLQGVENVKSGLLDIMALPQPSFWGIGEYRHLLTDEEYEDMVAERLQREAADEIATYARKFMQSIEIERMEREHADELAMRANEFLKAIEVVLSQA